MLQSMRSNLKGTIAFIIIGILIIPLALVGVEQFGSGGYSTDVATVNSDKISEQQLNAALSAQRNANPQANPEAVRQQVLDQLILASLLKQSAEDGGMTVSDERLNEILAARYQNNAQAYSREVRAMGLTSSSFNEYMKSSAASSQLQAALTSSHFVIESELENIIAIQQQQRDFSWVRLPIAPEIDKVELSDSEINEYYEANKSKFLSEETASFEYIDISPETFASVIDVSDSEIQQQYQSGVDEAANNTQKTIAHIFVEDSNENADQTIKVLQETLTPDNFNSLVKEYSDDLFSAEEGGILGVYPQDGLEEFIGGFETLEEGEVSTAFKGDNGTHFFKVVSIGASGSAPSLESVKSRLINDAKITAFEEAVEDLRSNAYNADTLKQYASENNLVSQKTDLVTRSSLPGPLANPAIAEQAFSAKVVEDGDVSDVVQLAERAVILKKVKYLAPEVLSLEQKREDIVAALKKDKAQALLESRAETIIARLDAGTDDPEVSYKLEKGIDRFNPAIDREIIGKVFTMAKPRDDQASTLKSALANGDLLIVKLDKVEYGKLSDIQKEEKEGLESFLENTYSTSEIISWVTELRAKAEVDIRPATQY